MQRTFLKRRHRNISLLSRSLLVEISSSSSSVIGASQHHSSITLMPSIRAMCTTLSYNGTSCCQRMFMRGCAATSCSSSRRYSKATCSSQVAHNISSFFDVHHCNTTNMLVRSSNSTSHFTPFNRQFYTQTHPQYVKEKKNDISSSSLNNSNMREEISSSNNNNTNIDSGSSEKGTAKSQMRSNFNLHSENDQALQQQVSFTTKTKPSLIIENDDEKSSEPSIHDISYIPTSLQPYAHLARLDKPIGTMLLLHPCLWSTTLAYTPISIYEITATAAATTSLPNFISTCTLFAIGSFIMRGAGCTINDMWDSKYDKNVERTKRRPLASGILSYKQAYKFLAIQLSAGLCVLLSLQPHVQECFVWGVSSLPLVIIYPLMKRYTNYPQLVLGLTFNWGCIMGWVAVHGYDINWHVVGPLYGSGVAWTLVYDTLYAHQDKVDDVKLGLKSTALTFGERGTKPILTALTGVAWGGWMMAGYNCGFGEVLDVPYYYMGVSTAGMHLLWQIYTADLNDSKNLAERFRSNNMVGWIVLGSCVVGNVAMAGGG